jgi:hypothetical protein
MTPARQHRAPALAHAAATPRRGQAARDLRPRTPAAAGRRPHQSGERRVRRNDTGASMPSRVSGGDWALLPALIPAAASTLRDDLVDIADPAGKMAAGHALVCAGRIGDRCVLFTAAAACEQLPLLRVGTGELERAPQPVQTLVASHAVARGRVAALQTFFRAGLHVRRCFWATRSPQYQWPRILTLRRRLHAAGRHVRRRRGDHHQLGSVGPNHLDRTDQRCRRGALLRGRRAGAEEHADCRRTPDTPAHVSAA